MIIIREGAECKRKTYTDLILTADLNMLTI